MAKLIALLKLRVLQAEYMRLCQSQNTTGIRETLTKIDRMIDTLMREVFDDE